jgi:tyramine---L-glutamate ligase
MCMRERLKILVFEYICGGGLAGQEAPASLWAEGCMMLQALVAELKSLPQVEVLLLLDKRCRDLVLPSGLEIIWVDVSRPILGQLEACIAGCDAVWPIAPETAGILAYIAGMVRSQGKTLLLSAPETVTLCGDKWATYQHLSAAGLPMAASHLLVDFKLIGRGPWVVKPRDGVGCQGGRLVTDVKTLAQLAADVTQSEQMLVQPYCVGESLSLSCLFKAGQAWLLCCNQQLVELVDGAFHLRACVVNVPHEQRAAYVRLIAQVAEALPKLWGYIGIDLIETAVGGPLILEINPRLTTSYAGIQAATGINVAEQVLALLVGEPVLPPARENRVTVEIVED